MGLIVYLLEFLEELNELAQWPVQIKGSAQLNKFFYAFKKHPVNTNHVPGLRLGPGATMGTRQASPVLTELLFPQGQQATNQEQINKQSVREWDMP